jgi:3-oxoadipate enol-lactonase/4-carboxymuconolactone decarboxylase
VVFADTGHLVPIEHVAQAAALTVEGHVGAAGAPTGGGAYDLGMATRRAVLGDAHVDVATARITPETAAWQDFITRTAWGDVWNRTDLTRRERSIATLASLVTGGHHAEVGMHVRAALRIGLTRDEITGVLLHTAIYAGIPASNEAFAVLRETLAAIDHEENSDG